MSKKDRGKGKGHEPIEAAHRVMSCLRRCSDVRHQTLEAPRQGKDHKTLRINAQRKGLRVIVEGGGKMQVINVEATNPARVKERIRHQLGGDYQVMTA